MIRFRKFLLGAVLVGATVLAAPTQARAAFKLFLQEAGVNGGAIKEVQSGADFSNITFSGVYGDFTVDILGGSSHNGSVLSDLLSSTTRVTNNSGTTQTLKLYVSQTDYTLPVGSPLVVESGLGGSVNVGTVGLNGIFQAYADK